MFLQTLRIGIAACATLVYLLLAYFFIHPAPSETTLVKAVLFGVAANLAPYLATLFLLYHSGSGFRFVASLPMIVVLIVVHFYIMAFVAHSSIQTYWHIFAWLEVGIFLLISVLFIRFIELSEDEE